MFLHPIKIIIFNNVLYIIDYVQIFISIYEHCKYEFNHIFLKVSRNKY